ncbi:MAG: Hsp33 family molecular chaperone [Alphaproteobacteria bacterium]
MSTPDPQATIAAANGDDLVLPFQIEQTGLRGRAVRLGPALDQILHRHNYPRPVARMLGEALIVTRMLAAMLKYDGVFTLQTRGDGAIPMMVADVTSDGSIRGYAEHDEEKLAALGELIDSEDEGEGKPRVHQLLGEGYLAFTVDQGPDTERYQGIVPLEGDTLADCVRGYFRQSEQLETGFRLAVEPDETGHWRASAISLQRLPEEGGFTPIHSNTENFDADSWRRAMILLGSVTDAELVDPDLSLPELLFRLFNEDGVRIFEAQPIQDNCRCSKDRIGSILKTLPEEDKADLPVEDGKIAVTCQFCSRAYTYEPEELEAPDQQGEA